MTTTQPAPASRQAPPDADPRLTGISTTALAREVRRRKKLRPGRDVRANPVSDKPGAAGNIAGVYKENGAFLDVTAQLMQAAGKRVGQDIDLLPRLEAVLAGDGRRIVAEACWALHEAGYSWSDIGSALGMTKSAAFERCEPYRPAGLPKTSGR
jgi:hypothetical protein